MLITFGIGIVVGLLLIVGVIKLTMGENPTGCMVLFGLLIFFVFWSALLMRWVMLAG